ncbi:mast cell protease 4-like isoform X1 [Carassius carassius]|uniref:mast cell protease 4-like isoform X1 n=1 Tax=Carassius carassius TaxID=217509 RepID=UPI0028695139|nr:mast cell protease 4-like isoform X1 [Carassius carassius]
MMTIISLLLLASLLPHLTFTARVNVGIVNGTEAIPHSRPYMVSIQNYFKHICGGFLISDEFVLTAAHCWKGYPEILTVVVGAHDFRKSEDSYRVEVKSYIPHQYCPFCSDWNDIMLLRLQKKVKLTNNVNWISLPKKCEDVKMNTLCSVAGWGRLRMKGPSSNCLREANTTTINHKVCKCKWGSEYFQASQMICAYGDGGSCIGDSGGPLVCGNTAVGVTSFVSSEGCNSPERPNVYTKISSYLPWIYQIIRNIN